uniref:Ankyrin repeat domain-containing protein n=1 Tax=Phaseolus vulgaris TaxID=3885 RepID=T2DPA1_PHAVU|nr:ankyrin repeat domain-containing protein [Phaseolus vulgaris]
MIIAMNSIFAAHNLRVFGPGLNPFAPYCIANHSLRARQTIPLFSPRVLSFPLFLTLNMLILSTLFQISSLDFGALIKRRGFFSSLSSFLLLVGWLVGQKGKDMLEEQPVLFRRSPSRRRLSLGLIPMIGAGTSLHVFARKGDSNGVKFSIRNEAVSAWGPKPRGFLRGPLGRVFRPGGPGTLGIGGLLARELVGIQRVGEGPGKMGGKMGGFWFPFWVWFFLKSLV